MFKCGQLVQAIHTGLFYMVRHHEGSVVMAESVRSGIQFDFHSANLRLVGNNYQPKTNTTAR